MTLSRDWATPLTIGAFAIMGVTGLLMFFELETGLNKPVHEWAGLVMVAAVVLHVAVNWRAFTRYLTESRSGRGIIAVGVLALAASFISPPGGRERGAPPPVLAMKAITAAPLTTIAPLTGRTPADLATALAAEGIVLTSPDASIASIIGDNRDLERKAMRVLFGEK